MSTSSWGRELKCYKFLSKDVTSLSTSSWGRELKYIFKCCHHSSARRPPREVVSWNCYVRKSLWRLNVDLLVRSWVEMSLFCFCCLCCSWSTSSWGRELKCGCGSFKCGKDQSTSSWGRELKWILPFLSASTLIRRPPREVVSWNVKFRHVWNGCCQVDLLVRSWVEISHSWKIR